MPILKGEVMFAGDCYYDDAGGGDDRGRIHLSRVRHGTS